MPCRNKNDLPPEKKFFYSPRTGWRPLATYECKLFRFPITKNAERETQFVIQISRGHANAPHFLKHCCNRDLRGGLADTSCYPNHAWPIAPYRKAREHPQNPS